MTEIIEELLALSKIFKEGFTCEVVDGKLQQYTNTDKPWIASYLTVVEIKGGKHTFKHISSIDNCIVGGWYDKDVDTYYIEIGASFQYSEDAVSDAKRFNQKCIYNIITKEIMEV